MSRIFTIKRCKVIAVQRREFEMRLHLLPLALLALFSLLFAVIVPLRGWSFPQQYGDSPRPVPAPRIRLSMGAAQARLKRQIEPEYPPAARRAGIQGDVTFMVVIGEDGRVKETHLRSGNPTFAKAATKAISEWEYRPYVFQGNATEVETFVTMHFRLPVTPSALPVIR
jgi:TonB family protein